MRSSSIGKVTTLLASSILVLVGWGMEAQARPARKSVKHLIVFIGDGMQREHENAASRHLYGREDALAFHALPYRGFVATWDATTYDQYAAKLGVPGYSPVGFNPRVGYDPEQGGKKPYPLQATGIDDGYFLPAGGAKPYATDSASAATALFAGIKTEDGNIAWQPGDPPGGAVKTLAELLREKKGAAIGVVSTVPFSHATPAALVSHNVSRNNYREIAREIIRTIQPEVVIGGGYPGVKGTNAFTFIDRAEYDYLKAPEAASPYLFVERAEGRDGAESLLAAADQAAAAGRKLFGLFGGPGGNFESPVAYDLPATPLVLRATAENPLLADATLAALKILSRDPDGFILMLEQGDIDWANHANDFKRMVGTVWDLHRAVQAAVDFVNRPGDEIDWENTLLIVTSDHGNSYMRLNATLAAGDLPRQQGACGTSSPACTYPDGEVSYRTTHHTNELVMLYLQGGPASLTIKRYEGAWYPCTRIIDNTQLFHFMAEAAGIAVESPLRPAIPKTKCVGR